MTEAPSVRAVALFGLYTFFMSQPSTSTPRITGTSSIPICLGELLGTYTHDCRDILVLYRRF